MPDEELPIHPYTGQRALGVLPSGRVVWPVLGGAPGDGDDDTDGGDSGDDDVDDGTDEGTDGDGLGDKGQKALAAERKARRDAEKARKALEAKVAALEAAASGKKDDADGAKPDADQIRRDAEAKAAAKANARILAAEIRAAAAGKLADPSDAGRYLDLSEFDVADDGTVDSDAITEAISDLIKRKPYLAAKATGFQGTGDGGARTGGSRPRQLTQADLKTMSPADIVKARKEGRLTRLLGAD